MSDLTEYLESLQREKIMNEKKEITNAAIDKEKTRATHESDTTTYRTVLIAACVGVLIGLLLRR